MRIGVVGLGNIGGHVAAHLVADGHEVTVHDRDAARCEAPTLAGAHRADDPEGVARRSEFTLLSLPTPEAVSAVCDAWLAGAARDSVLVDLSTNAPGVVRALGRRVASAGCHLLEAPLTGGAPGARARALVFLVGGDEAVYARCRPILEALSRAVFHLGPLGCGNAAKLVNSLLAFTSTWVSLEGLALAAKAGIDLRSMVEVVRTGGAGNFFMDRMVEGINLRGRPPLFALSLAAKDAALVVELAKEQAVPAPVAEQIAGVFRAGVDAGLGDRDWSEIVELIERQAGLELHLPPAAAGD